MSRLAWFVQSEPELIMAAKPKLSPEEWLEVRKVWEADARKGFVWLVQERSLLVSDEAVRQKAKAEGWAKDGEQPAKVGGASAKLGGKKPATRQSPAQQGKEFGAQGFGAGPDPFQFPNLPAGVTVLGPVKPTPYMDSLVKPRERSFVIEYCRLSGHGTNAAIAAGYAQSGASDMASDLLKREDIRGAIREYHAEMVGNIGWDVERVLQHYADIATIDTSKITQHRIRACRHCWGINHAYQCTPAEYQTKYIAHLEKRAGILKRTDVDIGEFPSTEGDWYNGRLDPNEECPECHGVGLSYTWTADTRKLTGAERKAIKGVKRTKDGLEVVIQDPEQAIDKLAKAMGLGKEDDKPAETAVEVAKSFAEVMAQARARQDEIYRERGITRRDRSGGDE